ncbi:protein phosphatase 2C domain-containing protein [Streptomyces sp. SAI-229]|uniref:protein phosphatase 2C domain-containing protein n=1 Tax=Streptomyces sp. SAI-229 TaxID=3377731 RepID=UPI003C7A9760
MSQQGERPTGPEDDWWGQLYDDATGDTGPVPAPDSLDDRFASASGTLNAGGPAAAGGSVSADGPVSAPGPLDAGGPASAGGSVPADGPVSASGPLAAGGSAPADSPAPHGLRSTPTVPDPRPAPDAPADLPPRPAGAPPRAPWEPPPAASAGPVTFPPPEPPPPPSQPPASSTPGTAYGPWTPATEPPPPPTAPPAPAPADGSASRPSRLGPLPGPLPSRTHVGSRPPTYDPEPTALPQADPDELDGLVPDTVLDGARYGACTLRAASVRGDSARYRGEPRRDALLTARFGTGERALVLVALATGARSAPGAHRAAAEACRWIGEAVGRSHTRLVDDIRAARRGDLKSGLHRLTDRSLGRLRAAAAEQGLEPDAYAATLRCLLLPADPECRTRVFFGVGPGGLFRLRDGAWQDIEPEVTEAKGEPVIGFGSPPAETPDGDRLTMDLGIPTPPSPYEPAPEPPREPFRFRTSIARPGDTLLMCGTGLADPLRGERELRAHLADRWSRPGPPGLAAFLADTQVRVKGYADDRTAAAVWEA